MPSAFCSTFFSPEQHPAREALRSPADLLRSIVDTEPLAALRRARRPNACPPAARGDLDTIVAKALKKRPEERYASVTDSGRGHPAIPRPPADRRPTRHAGLSAPASSSAATATAVALAAVGIRGAAAAASPERSPRRVGRRARRRWPTPSAGGPTRRPARRRATRLRAPSALSRRGDQRSERVPAVGRGPLRESPSRCRRPAGARRADRRPPSTAPTKTVSRLIAIGSLYGALERRTTRRRELLSKAYDAIPQDLADRSIRAKAACGTRRRGRRRGASSSGRRTLIRGALAELRRTRRNSRCTGPVLSPARQLSRATRRATSPRPSSASRPHSACWRSRRPRSPRSRTLFRWTSPRRTGWRGGSARPPRHPRRRLQG